MLWIQKKKKSTIIYVVDLVKWPFHVVNRELLYLSLPAHNKNVQTYITIPNEGGSGYIHSDD